MAISIENLVYHYPKNTATVLNMPSWRIQSGQRVFLHGPSGSGKSTLLNLLAGILPYQQGDIRVLDTSMHGLSSRQRDKFRAQHIGYVFQQFNLIPYLSAVENIRLAAEVSHKPLSSSLDDAISELLVSLQLDAKIWHLSANKLSIGQQQRVAIARALIKQPELLIVDEPTSALDTENRDALMQLLLEHTASRQITLLFVSHDKQLTPYFDEVVSLADINQL